MNYISLICARGGSKGLKNKNIMELNNIPLVGWSINSAKNIDQIKDVFVSTDSKDIASIAKSYGAKIPFLRPMELAEDSSSEWLVWQHAVNFLEKNGEIFDAIVVLPPTAPLRSDFDITNAIDIFEKNNVDAVISVTDSHRSPFFNMVKNNEDGFAEVVLNNKDYYRRQDVPQTFDMTTAVYVVKRLHVKNSSKLFDGKILSSFVPKERAVDIDDIYDFQFAEFLLNRRDVK